MAEYLKQYHMRITALSPIHIGCGQMIGKKEYIYLEDEKKVIVPDLHLMYAALEHDHLERDFQKFMLENRYDTLYYWLKKLGYNRRDFESWSSYELDAGKAFERKTGNRNAATPKEIAAFIKDAYGMPYVPGSSIKGMIRTALLAYVIDQNKDKYERLLSDLTRQSTRSGRRETFLKRETDALEEAVFHTLNRNEKQRDAVNSVMSGLIISDSAPLSTAALTLSQKVDRTLQNENKDLPILRETLKPGTKIEFTLTIDSTVFPFSINTIMDALEWFRKQIFTRFYSKFGHSPLPPGTVWIGGGAGFLSKTILYPVYGNDALKIADSVFKSTLGKIYFTHKHDKDLRLGIAPHVTKCTRYRGKLNDMGMGQITIVE